LRLHLKAARFFKGSTMHSGRQRLTVLVVDDDEVLLTVLTRVLTRAGYEVLRAASVAEAQQQPLDAVQVGLVDLSLPDGNGVDLARALHQHHPGLPLILMTAYPNRVREQSEAASEFRQILTKPVDLEQLRHIIAAALTEEPMSQPKPAANLAAQEEPVSASLAAGPRPLGRTDPARRPPAGNRLLETLRFTGVLLIILAVVFFFFFFVLGVQVPGMSSNSDPVAEKPPAPASRGVEGARLVEGQPHTLFVPEEVRASLGIRKGEEDLTYTVKVPTETRPLILYGSTALDPARLVRIRARFAPCEVVKIGEHRNESGNPSGPTEFRELRPGDRVKKGQELGVFFSVDVGSKKNDLLDALVQLELDQKILDNAEKSAAALPAVFLLNAQKAVQNDRNAINRALNNLKVWNIPQDEIDALHEEAKKLSADKDAWFKTPEGRWVRGEKQGVRGGEVDPDKENNSPWGKVTLRAPFDGIIVERNVTLHETVVDNTVNLFQIAQVKRLLVIANAPEDDLPTLNALKDHDRSWTVRTVGASAVTGIPGRIEEIGYLIDPNQHTAVIKGYIDNPDEQIRAGQYVSATVRIPPPPDVVEIPADAVVEDGKYAVVFVQAPDRARLAANGWSLAPQGPFQAALTAGPASSLLGVAQAMSLTQLPTDPNHYTMRRVQVTHRLEGRVFVRSTPLAAQEQLTADEKALGLLPRERLCPGERILRTGVGELKAALLDLESRSAKDTTLAGKGK
jgi:cobalt-zinc-cadmium efflux system membrane fusion protein